LGGLLLSEGLLSVVDMSESNLNSQTSDSNREERKACNLTQDNKNNNNNIAANVSTSTQQQQVSSSSSPQSVQFQQSSTTTSKEQTHQDILLHLQMKIEEFAEKRNTLLLGA
jgi:hypothetical protein